MNSEYPRAAAVGAYGALLRLLQRTGMAHLLGVTHAAQAARALHALLADSSDTVVTAALAVCRSASQGEPH